MAQIALKNVVAEFPVYGSQPSLRNALFGRVVGGALPAPKRGMVSAWWSGRSNDVTLTVRHGDQLGIIGHNGAGKSTCCAFSPASMSQARERSASTGRHRRCSVVRRASTSTIPATKNRDLRPVARHEPRRDRTKLPEIEAFSELSDYLALPARTYSTGMLVRLGFAIATAIDPEDPAARRGAGCR